MSDLRRRAMMARASGGGQITPVTYVETTGANWIDTGVILQNDMLFVLQWYSVAGISMADRLGDDQCFLSRVNGHYCNGSLMFGVKWEPYIAHSRIRTLTIDCANGVIKQNVANASSVNAVFVQPTKTFLVGSNYPVFSRHCGIPDLVRFYELTITQNNAVPVHLIPVVDGKGKACIYDTITGRLIYPSGTGDLNWA